MAQAVDHLYHELTGVRTGRASPALIETLQVNSGHGHTQLSHLGTIVARGPHSLSITVYDKDNTQAIIKAIADSPLGLNGMAEHGEVIVHVPEMNPETRSRMVKLAHQYAEGARGAIRAARKKALADLKKAGVASEDDRKRIEKLVDELTKKHIASVDSALQRKETDLS